MYVCVCARVRERELRAVISAGARNVESVGAACGAGQRCGTCLDRISALLGTSHARPARDTVGALAA